MLAGPKVGEQWEKVGNLTQGEKRGRLSLGTVRVSLLGSDNSQGVGVGDGGTDPRERGDLLRLHFRHIAVHLCESRLHHGPPRAGHGQSRRRVSRRRAGGGGGGRRNPNAKSLLGLLGVARVVRGVARVR
eukprot:276022-Prorocentrum_minimum.AAC.8